jgi:hypothetical protein
MLCISQTPTEDLWLAFPPSAYFSNQLPPFDLATSYPDSRLSTAHYRIILAFLIDLLVQLPGHNYYSFDAYN